MDYVSALIGVDWTNGLFFLMGAIGALIGLLFAWGISAAAGRETPSVMPDGEGSAYDLGYNAGFEDGVRDGWQKAMEAEHPPEPLFADDDEIAEIEAGRTA